LIFIEATAFDEDIRSSHCFNEKFRFLFESICHVELKDYKELGLFLKVWK
jgi:hypothetical protein